MQKTIPENLPPHNLEAEKCILGTMILDNQTISSLLDLISEKDFYSEIHRLIFKEIKDLFNEEKTVDVVVLKNRLKEKSQLQKIGGASYLADLVNSVFTTRNVLYYAEKIKEKRILRDLFSALETIIHEDNLGVEEVLNKAQDIISEVSKEKTETLENIVPVKDIAESLYTILNENLGVDFPFKFPPLKKFVGGLDKGMLTIIGGYTSQGKSTLSIELADQFASDGIKVLFCSSEMTEMQIVERIICRRCHIDSQKFRNLALTAEEKEAIREEIEIMDIPLWICRVSTVSDIRSFVRKIEPDIVFVDHIHQMVGKGNSEYEMISNIVVGLKNLAMDEDISVIAVSQLHRTIKEGLRSPRLSDLRASGRIEENAQLVIFVYWPYQIKGDQAKINREKATKNNREKATKNDVLLTVAKQTAGPIGYEKIFFNPQFYELTERWES